jgi:hypothetical protein
MDEWGNWNIEIVWHEDGWSSENTIYCPSVNSGVFASRPLMRDMPPRIRRIDIAIAQLPDEAQNVCRAKYWFNRWPEGHSREGEQIYDSDRAAWFGMGTGWFKTRLRRAKIAYKNIREGLDA